MSSLSLAVMILVTAVVWGGFVLCLVAALRKEGRKPCKRRINLLF